MDVIDKVTDQAPGSALHKLRRLRPEFVDGAETCYLALLSPVADQGLGPDLRFALARRISLLNQDAALASHYGEHALEDPALQALANGAADLPEPLATIARHADMVTLHPSQATADHIRALEAAGLSNPQIVALSELIAFVNFQTRIAAGLRLMGAA